MATEFEGLFVKFGANTVEFDNSVKGMNKALTGLKKEFQTINKQLKFDPDNIDLLNKKMENLQEQAKVGALKIEELRKKQADLGNEKVGTEEWNKLELEIQKVEQQMQVVDRTMQATASRIKEVGDPSSIHNLDKALDEVAQDLDTVNKKLQLNPNDVEAAAEKMELLGKQARLADEKVEALKKEQAALGEEKIGTDEWKALEREIVEAQLEAKEFRSELDNIGEASTSLDDIGSKLDAANLMEAAEALSGVGESIIDFGGQALDAFREVDDAMDTITGKTGMASDEFKGLYENISSSIAVDSLTDIGSALGEVNTQFGLTDQALEDASVYMLKFAQINETDVTQSTINAKQAMDLFGLSTDQLPAVLDAVTGTAQRTGQSVDSLFGQVEKGAPSLQRMGLDFDTSVEVLGQFAKSGLDADKTVSALTKATGVYAKQGKTLNDGLAETSDRIKNAASDQDALNLATEIFGAKQGPAMADAIKNGTLDLEQFGAAAKENGGLVGETFEKQKDPIDEITVAQQQLTNTMAELGGAIAETLAPVFETLVDVLKAVSQMFNAIPGPVKQFIIIFGGVLAVVAMLTPIIAAVVAIFTAGLLPAMGIAIGVIAGVVAVIVGVIVAIKNWGGILEWLKGVWAGVGTFFSGLWEGIKEVFAAGFEWIKGLWEGMKVFFSGFWTALQEIFNIGLNVLLAIVTGVVNLIKAAIELVFNGIKAYFELVFTVWKTIFTVAWNVIVTVVTTAIEVVKSVITTGFNIIKTVISTVLNTCKAIISAVWNGITATISTAVKIISNVVSSTFNTVKNIITTVMNTIINIVNSVWQSVVNVFRNGVNSIINVVSGIGDKIANFFRSVPSGIMQALGDLSSIGKAIVDGIIGGIGDLGGAIMGKITSAISGVKNAASGLISGIFGKSFSGTLGIAGEYGGAIGSMYKLKADGLMSESAASSSSTTNLNISVQATGNDANAIATAVERQIVRRLTR
ncbi:phage tail tape measure protein [Enterococcus sp. BWR-S5]|uniref:phage tail tape measure protein n=1 Tax=Enterococcus sp. BWR-S5 TaxID=2787714 RepID=UPI001924C555|nr:phage tail tape measure protein [Enterococcus sp. BWR-S5]MBL1223737.1 phage tail tape measure protein [Enterococcus sp. BWR-S5]